jgi:hypothetical protein
MHAFRVFVSYSHRDLEMAEQVVKILNEMGLTPVWDKNIRPGMPFTDEIKNLIGYSHVFMPLITERSKEVPWVHQETGYAMAMNIPVLPVAIGNPLPSEMIAQLHGISVQPDLTDLDNQLRQINFEQMMRSPSAKASAIVEIADWPETRTKLMARFANRVMELGEYSQARQPYSKVRQQAELSSFCIPDKSVDDPIWDQRSGTHARSLYYYSLLREERRALEDHAREEGCYLIIDPTVDLGKTDTTAVRLSILLEFLCSMPDDKVQVVTTARVREGNLTIVGDWFVAESLVRLRSEGYRQTVFSWHAPTVLRWVRKFDQEFQELYKQSGLEPGASRKAAIEQIEKIIAGLPQRPISEGTLGSSGQ